MKKKASPVGVVLLAAAAAAAAVAMAVLGSRPPTAIRKGIDPVTVDASVDLSALAILGRSRPLASDAKGMRIELTVASKSELVAEEVATDASARHDFVLGVLRTTSEERPVATSSGVFKVVVHHRILPAVAYVRADGGGSRRAWLDAHAAWGLRETQREVDVMLFQDAAAGGPSEPPPPPLRCEGRVRAYGDAVALAPELATPSVRAFLCKGEDGCNDALLASVVVFVADDASP